MSNLHAASSYTSVSPTPDKLKTLIYLFNIKRFKDLKIGRKLDIGFGIFVILMFLVVGSIFVAGRRATQNINLTEDVRVPAALSSAQAQSSLLEMQASLRGYLVLSDLNNIDTYNKAKAVFEINLAQLETLSADWDSAEDETRAKRIGHLHQRPPLAKPLGLSRTHPLRNSSLPFTLSAPFWSSSDCDQIYSSKR